MQIAYDAGQPSRHDFRLSVGEASTTVEVTVKRAADRDHPGPGNKHLQRTLYKHIRRRF